MNTTPETISHEPEYVLRGSVTGYGLRNIRKRVVVLLCKDRHSTIAELTLKGVTDIERFC